MKSYPEVFEAAQKIVGREYFTIDLSGISYPDGLRALRWRGYHGAHGFTQPHANPDNMLAELAEMCGHGNRANEQIAAVGDPSATLEGAKP